MEKQAQRRRRVALVSCPFQGHQNPMLELASILLSHGFSITVIHTQLNPPNSSIYPEFDFQILQNVNLDDVPAMQDLLPIVIALNDRCKTPLKECLEQMIQQKDLDHEVGCVIYDDFMFFSAEVANQLKLPSIVLRTASAAASVSRLTILRLKSEGHFPVPDSMSEETLPELPAVKYKDVRFHLPEIPHAFFRLMANSCDLKTASAVIWNTMDCLEEPVLANQKDLTLPAPIFSIGPIHKFAPPSTSPSSTGPLKPDRTCISWLDKQQHNSVLYISMGSVVSLDEKDLAEMASVLRNRKQPFLWVIRPGLIPGFEWSEMFPKGFIEDVGERGCIVKWAPQKEVLAHPAVGGFWTHGGWNSTLESIAEGVPMICSPSFGDQIITSRYVSNVWGNGLALEDKLERKEIERCVTRVMEDEEIRRKAMELKEKVEISIKEGGSSSNSVKKLVEFISSL